MEYKIYSHRYGQEIINSDSLYSQPFNELLNLISSITDQEIINKFQHHKYIAEKKEKSLSIVLNELFKEKLKAIGWKTETRIFKEDVSVKGATDWKLDFTYRDIFSVEIAFNHASAICVNLLKPVLASELNHVKKEYQTKFGIIITATNNLKEKGGFDGAIGTFESYSLQCIPLMNQLTAPMVIIGLEAPSSFEIVHEKTVSEGGSVRYRGSVKLIPSSKILEKQHFDENGELINMILY